MKLSNIGEVNDFLEVVNRCEGDVWLQSTEGDKINLKSSLSQHVGIHPGRFREHYGTEPQGTERTNTNICQVVAHSVARPGIRENSKEIN